MLCLIGLNLSIIRMNNKKDKIIQVYDDLFDFNSRTDIYDYVRNSFFKIGWADTDILDTVKHEFIHSAYSKEDVDKLGFFEKLKKTPIMNHIEDLEHKHTIVNLSTPSDSNFIHFHQEKLVVLYYVNLNWGNGWHGETLFYDEWGRDIIFASSYTPGRIIVFDASIPHTIRPQSIIGPKFRFTLSSFFDYPNKNLNNEN